MNFTSLKESVDFLLLLKDNLNWSLIIFRKFILLSFLKNFSESRNDCHPSRVLLTHKTDWGESIASDYIRYLFCFLFCIYVCFESGHGAVWRKLDLECFAALYLYGALSVVYRMEQKKPASPFTSDERKAGSLAALEFCRIWVILCSFMLCVRLLTWLADRRHLANHDAFRVRCLRRCFLKMSKRKMGSKGKGEGFLWKASSCPWSFCLGSSWCNWNIPNTFQWPIFGWEWFQSSSPHLHTLWEIAKWWKYPKAVWMLISGFWEWLWRVCHSGFCFPCTVSLQ